MWSSIFPPICLGCERLLRHGDSLALCSRCRPSQPELAESQLLADGIGALFPYEGPLARAVVALKFSGALALAGPLGRLLADRGELIHAPSGAKWDLVIPVPLHWSRRLWRGFDQAEELARWALRSEHRSGEAGRLATGVLRRRRATRAQTQLDADTRAANVAGAFELRRPALVLDRRVLLLDDVITTGATMRECRQVLLDAGAKEVGGLTLLRTV